MKLPLTEIALVAAISGVAIVGGKFVVAVATFSNDGLQYAVHRMWAPPGKGFAQTKVSTDALLQERDLDFEQASLKATLEKE